MANDIDSDQAPCDPECQNEERDQSLSWHLVTSTWPCNFSLRGIQPKHISASSLLHLVLAVTRRIMNELAGNAQGDQ
jgi:hypothetical protein